MAARNISIFTIEDAARALGVTAKDATISLKKLGNAILDYGYSCTSSDIRGVRANPTPPTALFYTYEEFMNGA